MRRQLFTKLLLVLASIGGGSLECNPIVLSRPEQHGGDTYNRMCAVCHGASGEGYKADQAPALAQADFIGSVTDEFLRAAITNGRGGTTMSAWGVERGGPLTRGEVDSLVLYMRRWQQTPRPKLDESPLAADAGRGSLMYAKDCARCHGARGLGGTNINLGNPELLATASNGFLRYAVRGGRSQTAMPGFIDTLGEPAIDDVLQYVRTFQVVTPTTPRTPPARPPPIPLGPVPLNPHGPEPVGFRLTPLTTPADTIKHELDRGAKMAILDARAPSDYANDHIIGAVSVPFYDPDAYFPALPHDAWIVCYCACPHAESGQLAQKLLTAGFTKVTVLDEGLGVWRTRNYGVHAGLEP